MPAHERPNRDLGSRVRAEPEPLFVTPPASSLNALEPSPPAAFGFRLADLDIYADNQYPSVPPTSTHPNSPFGQPVDDPHAEALTRTPPELGALRLPQPVPENQRGTDRTQPSAFSALALSLQRDALTNEADPQPDQPDPHAQLGAAKGGGQPLPDPVRSLLETRWDTDLSGVRVHTDQTGDAVSQGFEARALTSGSDIFFRAGTWNPDSLEGLQLIAHESWHAVQQGRGAVQGGVDADGGLESEAKRKGTEFSHEDLDRTRAPAREHAAPSAPSSSPANTSANTFTNTFTNTVQREPMPVRDDTRKRQTEAAPTNTAAQPSETAAPAQPTDAVTASEPAVNEPQEAALEVMPVPEAFGADDAAPDSPPALEGTGGDDPSSPEPETTADAAGLDVEPQPSAPHDDGAPLETAPEGAAQDNVAQEDTAQLETAEDAASDSSVEQSDAAELHEETPALLETTATLQDAHAVQREPEPDAAPQVTPEAAQAAGQQLIASLRDAVSAQTQAVTALAVEHATEITHQAQSAAQTIHQTSSQHRNALSAAIQNSRTQAATHTAGTKAAVQGAVSTQRGALQNRTATAVAQAQRTVTAKQTETTQTVNQELTTLGAQQQQTLQGTQQRFQSTRGTAQQTGNSGGSSGIAPEVGEAKQKAGQQMGEDAAKDVDQAGAETQAALQQKGAQASALFRQQGAQAAAQITQTLPGTRAALQQHAHAGAQQLTQLGTQTATTLTHGQHALNRQLGAGGRQALRQLEHTGNVHAQQAKRVGDRIAASIRTNAEKTNARTRAALKNLEAKAVRGVNPSAVGRITAQVTGKLNNVQSKIRGGAQTLGAHTRTALNTGSSHAAQGLEEASTHASTTAQTATQQHRTHLDGLRATVLPATAQITNTTTQAQTQVNTDAAATLTAMGAEHKKNFSAGRDQIITALNKDGQTAADTAKGKVTGELRTKVSEGQEKIETKASQEKAGLEQEANNKDGQTRAQQATTAPAQREPVQRWAWLDSVFDWFGKQWDKLKSTFLSPSFWAGLIVGLVVAIAIVAAVAAIIATGGAAAGVLLALGPLLLPVVGGVAGAAAGFAGTVASNVTHNLVQEKGPDGQFHERGIFEGAGRNTLLGLGAGVALAYAPATLPWLIGGGAAINVGVGIYDNVQNGKPWYESLGADAIIGGVTALIGFGAFKGYAGAARGTRFNPENIPTNAQERANTQETLNKPQQLRDTYANELRNSSFAERLAEIERNPNVTKRGEALDALERDMQRYQDYYNKAIRNGLPEELARQSADANANNPVDKPKQSTSNLDDLYNQARDAAPELNKATDNVAEQTGGRAEYRKDSEGNPSVKGRDRAQEKVEEYQAEGADADKLVDIAGARIVYKTLAEAYNALKIIRENFDVVYFKDRYASPVPSGFRDILLNVKMSNGHIVELRVTLESIENIAKIEHAESYGPRRTIDKTMKAEGRTEYTPQEQAIIDGFISKYKPMYDAAWKSVLENFQNKGR